MDVYSEIQYLKEKRRKMEKELIAVTSLTFDRDLYSVDKFEGYEYSIPVNDDDDDGKTDPTENDFARKISSFTAPKQFYKEIIMTGDDEEDYVSVFNKKPSKKIIDREDDYKRRRLNRLLSPARYDPFSDKTPGPEVRTYADVMREEALKRREEEVKRAIAKKMKEDEEKPNNYKVRSEWDEDEAPTPKQRQRLRWDETPTPKGLMCGEEYNLSRRERDIEDRNKPLTDEDLVEMLPRNGYKVLNPPSSYRPGRKLLATPTPMVTPLYDIPEENRRHHFNMMKEMPQGLPFM